MSTRKSPALPAFSYAQAAKGLTPVSTTPVPSGDSKSGPSSAIERKASDSIPVEAESNAQVDAPEGNDTLVKELAKASTQPASTEKSDGSQVQPSSLSASTATLQKDDDASVIPNGSSDSTWEKQSQTSANGDKSLSKDDGKGKDTDDDWEKISVPSVPAEKELKAAPLPAVNVWQQRKEAQEAKAKAIAAQKPVAAASPPATKSKDVSQGVNGYASKPGNKAKSFAEDADGKDRKKPLEAGKAGQEARKLPRPIRSTNAEKESSTAPPPVNDASLWPTPETSAVEERKPSLTEKSEKPEDIENKSQSGKVHTKEKWVKVDHVPSVKWEYYTPPVSTRRGGRPARGGREGGRGGHMVNGNTERTEKSGVMGPPAVPKAQRQEDRGRTEASAESTRSDSNPVATSRSSSAVTGATDDTKANESTKTEQTQVEIGDSKPESGAVAKEPATNKAEAVDSERIRSSSKTSSRFNSGYKGNNYDPARAAGYHSESHGHPRSDRRSMPPDFFNQNDVFGRERGEKGRDHTGDKTESSREGKLSWRDRDGQSERPERREQRSERGRGGYRGRGNYNNHGSHNSQNQSWSTPLPQHPFPSKSHSYNERHRQPSASFAGQMQQPQTSRSNPRSHSIPSNGYSTTGSIPQQPLSPTQQDFQGMYYSMGQNFPIIDYQLINTMKMVQTQIEYYFSIENLCKDLYLRRHMDSQGYVLLSFIASFKRLRQLTEDMSLIRDTCAQITSLEYVRGDDGVERLRRREGWGQWILSTEERDPSAQNAGPTNVTAAAFNFYDRYPQMYGPGFTLPPNQDMGVQSWMNGNPNQHFSMPAYGYGRNDYEFQPMSASATSPHGGLEHLAEAQQFEPKMNGIPTTASPDHDFAYENGKVNGVNGIGAYPNAQFEQVPVSKDLSASEDNIVHEVASVPAEGVEQ